MTQIKKTTEAAIKEAKINCIRQFEEMYGISVSDDAFLSDEQIWLEKNTSVECNCGQTSAVEMVLFTNRMNKELVEFVNIDEDDQFYSTVGICEHCGEE